jgi:putative ABC transport system permease protein
LKAIFHVKDKKNLGAENQLMMNWKYFDESNDYIKSQVSWYTVQLADASQASRVARAIDAISANSDHETKSQTESAFQQAFAKQFADIGLIVTAIMGAVFFTLLLLTGNTMAQAVRERIPELAVLKTLGFRDGTVIGLVLTESVLLVVLGGLIGLGLSAVIMPGVAAASGGVIQLPNVPAQTWVIGLVLMVLIGAVVGLLPALRAKRLKIVDALAGR